MLKAEVDAEQLPSAASSSVHELCQQVDKWLSERHFSSAALYTYRALPHLRKAETTTPDMLLLQIRLLLFGIVGGLAALFDGGGHDEGQLLRVVGVLLKELETYCGGAEYLSRRLLGKPGVLPFLSAGQAAPPAVPLASCFDSGLFFDAYVENLVQVIAALEALLLIATALRRCADKDDRNRLEVCDNVGKASCWIGCMKASDAKTLLEGTLASIEGNWTEVKQHLHAATAKKQPSQDIKTLSFVLNVLMGGSEAPADAAAAAARSVKAEATAAQTDDCAIPDVLQLLARCGVVGENELGVTPPNEVPLSIGGLLELADELFAVKKISEATVLLDRCEELLTCNKRVSLERCGIRNYRSELLYQRGRIYQASKKDMAAARVMYEASLSYCPHHLASIYQLAKISHMNTADDNAGNAQSSATAFPSVLGQVSAEGSSLLKTICRLREGLEMDCIPPGYVNEVLELQLDPNDLEAQRLELEVLRKISQQNCGDRRASAASAAILINMMRVSVSYVPQAALQKCLSQKQKLTGATPAVPELAASEPQQPADDDDLFGEEVAPMPELKVSDLVFIVLARHTIPTRWMFLLAKFLTNSCHPESIEVWKTLRNAAMMKRDSAAVSKSEIGMLIALHVNGSYDLLHSRLKKLLMNPAPNGAPGGSLVDQRSREVVVMRVLHHISRGELTIARQLVERALSYVDNQINVSGGQNMKHWQTYSVYLDLLCVTRLGNPFDCKTKGILQNIFKKDTKRIREDASAKPLPSTLRSKIQMLVSWITLQQANFAYLQRAKSTLTTQIPKMKNYKALYAEAKRLALTAVETDCSNWRAGLVMAEACKGLKQLAVAQKVSTSLSEYVTSNARVSWRERDYIQNYLLKETACILAAEKPAPAANKGKLLRTVSTVLEKDLGLNAFLVRLALAVKDPSLGDTVFSIIVDFMRRRPAVDKTGSDASAEPEAANGDNLSLEQWPLKLVYALARVGTIACMERAKNLEGIKNPTFLANLVSDAELVANAFRKLLVERQRYSIETAPTHFIPSGPRALEYLVHQDQPVIGPMPSDVARRENEKTMNEAVITQSCLDELPDIDELQRRLVEDVEALVERLTELQPLVRQEYAMACAVREERLRESEKLLRDIEARAADEDDVIIFGSGGAA